MRNIFALAGLLLAGLACAAFDFQFQPKYSSSANVDTSFTHVVSVGTESYVLGKVANDIFVAKMDSFGNMVVYLYGMEATSAYSAKYLSNGVRSAQRRLAGTRAVEIDATGSGVWLAGEVPTRKRGRGPFAARYSK